MGSFSSSGVLVFHLHSFLAFRLIRSVVGFISLYVIQMSLVVLLIYVIYARIYCLIYSTNKIVIVFKKRIFSILECILFLILVVIFLYTYIISPYIIRMSLVVSIIYFTYTRIYCLIYSIGRTFM